MRVCALVCHAACTILEYFEVANFHVGSIAHMLSEWDMRTYIIVCNRPVVLRQPATRHLHCCYSSGLYGAPDESYCCENDSVHNAAKLYRKL